jgi:biotin carboxyl carrier protein
MDNEFVNPNGQTAQITPIAKKRYGNWPLIIVAALFIIVPFLTWYGTWFGRSLSDETIAEYLTDEKSPRHIQHALIQLETRIEKGDASAKKFYPQIEALTTSPHAEIRKTIAWVMGQDNTSEDFHRALLRLLNDSEPLVRRNAALQLVRFGDASGRPELRAMLQSFEVKSPMNGTIVSILPVGSNIRAGALLARIREVKSIQGTDDSSTQGSNSSDTTQASSGDVQEFRSPVDGRISPPAVVKEGDQIAANQNLAWLTPDRETITDALRALGYIGTKDDLPLIETYTNSTDADLRTAAVAAIESISGRVHE